MVEILLQRESFTKIKKKRFIYSANCQHSWSPVFHEITEKSYIQGVRLGARDPIKKIYFIFCPA